MNILEHYIVEIHEEKELEKYPYMLEIDVTCDCWGDRQRTKHITHREQWYEDVKRGFFMA